MKFNEFIFFKIRMSSDKMEALMKNVVFIHNCSLTTSGVKVIKLKQKRLGYPSKAGLVRYLSSEMEA